VSNERFVCTTETPWTNDKGRAIHPDAKCIGEVDFGGGEYCEKYECPNCQLRFYVEIAQ
jgi:hypothetical protein